MINQLLCTLPCDPIGRAQENQTAAALQSEMEHVARVGIALDLRQAQLLAWLKRQDLASLGWPSFSAFCTEYVGWSLGWIRQLIRLVESDLPHIKAQVAAGQLPLYRAVAALAKVTSSTEQTWLATQRRPDKVERFLLFAPDTQVVTDARERARLLAGRKLSCEAADEFLLQAHEQALSGQDVPMALLDRAREKLEYEPPPPVPHWEEQLTACLGAWTEPSDLASAVERLQQLQKQRRRRVVELGELYIRVRGEWVWSMGHDSHQELARSLGVSLRSLERHALLVQWLEMFPALEQALHQGMSLGRIHLLGDIVTQESVDRWLLVAKHMPVAELKRAISLAHSNGAEATLANYERIIADAKAATRPDAQVLVALGGPAPKPIAPVTISARVGLFEAAQWFLSSVRVPPRYGFGKVVQRDGHLCQNPRCEHRSLRVQAHHLVFRSHGGSDDPRNGVGACPGCHLRGLHAGKMTATRHGEWVIWRYADGAVIWSWNPPDCVRSSPWTVEAVMENDGAIGGFERRITT